MGASPWPHPPLKTCQTVNFVCGAMRSLHLCTLKLVSFPARLTPTGSRSRTPQEMKEGSENLNPIIFGQLGPFWSQNSKKNQLWHKNPTGAVSVTYRTTLVWALPEVTLSKIEGAFILSNTSFWKVAMFRAPVYTCAETSPTEKLSDVLACFSW